MGKTEKPPIFPILQHYGLEEMDQGGGRMKVRCPFHDDSRPSASVDLDRQRFRCFTCDMSHDAYSLVMEREGIDSFTRAVEYIEENFGFRSETVSPGSNVRPLRSSLFVANRGSRAKSRDARGVAVRRRKRGLR